MPKPAIATNERRMKLEEENPKDAGKGKDCTVGMVNVIPEEEEIFNATKRDAEGWVLPKQPKKRRTAVEK